MKPGLFPRPRLILIFLTLATWADCAEKWPLLGIAREGGIVVEKSETSGARPKRLQGILLPANDRTTETDEVNWVSLKWDGDFQSKTLNGARYRPLEKMSLDSNDEMLLFDRQQQLVMKESAAGADFYSGARLAYRIVHLSSAEGIHAYVQTWREGNCVETLDHYRLLGYDVEPHSEEQHRQARCGNVVTGR